MSSTDPRVRRLACALALPAFPLALLAADLVSPTDSVENADQLTAAVAHGSAWEAAALLELLAAFLLPLAVAGMVHSVRGRGSTLATVGGALGALGTLGMTLIAARHLFVYGLVGTDRATALHVLDRLEHGANAIAFPLMFGGPFALIALTAALTRAGITRRSVAAGAVLFFVVDMLPIPEAEVVQSLVGLATFGTVARSTFMAVDPRKPAAFDPARPEVAAAQTAG